MKVIALQEYTDKYISMFEGEIREITDEILADELIANEILAEKSDEEETPVQKPVLNFTYDETEEEWSCNYTWEEIESLDEDKNWVKIDDINYPIFVTSVSGSTLIWFVRMSFNSRTKLELKKISMTEEDVITAEDLTYKLETE